MSLSKGFSLLELSIVLVIIGLLAGGVMVGQDLVRQSELRSVMTDYSKFQTALNAFKNKYSANPGDMRDATRYWGRMNSNADCVTNSSAAVSAAGACDGNGNTQVTIAAAASQVGESFQFWRHLSLAGMVEGSHTGIAGSGNAMHAVPDVNVPSGKMTGTGWAFRFLGVFAGDGSAYALDYGNMFEFGGQQSAGSVLAAALTPGEAFSIDSKLDDGKPATGKIVARFWNNACSVADDGTSAFNDLVASYKLSDSSVQCVLHFRNQF